MSAEVIIPQLHWTAEPARLSPIVLSGAAALMEGVLTVITGLFIFHAYLQNQTADDFLRYCIVIVLATQVYVATAGNARLYDLAAFRRPLQCTGPILLVWSCVFAVLIVFAFLTKTSDSFSRIWLIGWYASGYTLLFGFRFMLAKLMRRWTKAGRIERRVVIVGGDERTEKLIDALHATPDGDIRICGIFDDRTARVPARVRGYPMLGSIKTLVEYARTRRVDLLLVNLPITAERRIGEMMNQLHVLPVDIRLAAQSTPLRLAPSAYSYVGKVPTLEIANRPVADWGQLIKAAEDRVLAAIFLFLSLPLFAVVAAAIKWDSKGPVFFKQKRYGFNNELIEVYKFRTLRHEKADANAEKLVGPGDDRVTRVGRFLRRTSIDELPQLITVLKGGMSMVGPRPHATAAKAGNRLYQEVADGYYARHRVKPGITGWAQINGWRGDTDTEEKLLRRTEHDLYYIEHWSLWFDLAIIARTPLALVRGTNAH